MKEKKLLNHFKLNHFSLQRHPKKLLINPAFLFYLDFPQHYIANDINNNKMKSLLDEKFKKIFYINNWRDIDSFLFPVFFFKNWIEFDDKFFNPISHAHCRSFISSPLEKKFSSFFEWILKCGNMNNTK